MSLRLRAEIDADADAVCALIDAVFGPARLVRAAERLREGRAPLLELCRVLEQGGVIVGAVQLWPILIGAAPALLLGPLAVEPRHRNAGLGARLIRAACAAADAAGQGAVLLVGDEPYYSLFGFRIAPREVRMPGPVDPDRVLVRGAVQALAGQVRPG